MSSPVNVAYGTETALTLNADGLASAACRQSTFFTTAANAVDYEINAQVKTATGTLGANPAVRLWIYAVSQGGSSYTDNCTGSDGSFTMPTSPNIKLLDAININASNTLTPNLPKCLSNIFPGAIPAKWGIVVDNETGLALSGTAGQGVVNLFSVTPVYYTVG